MRLETRGPERPHGSGYDFAVSAKKAPMPTLLQKLDRFTGFASRGLLAANVV
jgi:hypothetical protein